MNIIHSCWTKPMTAGKERWNIPNQIEKNLWLYAYSVDYLLRLNQPIELYTDTFGASVFDCIPYDKIHNTLDSLEDVHERFWSAGKIAALEAAPLGSIHIDGDVFLKKHDVLDVLSGDGKHHCVVQMHERLSIFMESYNNILPMFQEAVGDAVKGFNYNLTEAVNCGVFGFTSSILKDEYIRGYWQILNIIQQDQKFMSLLKYDLEKKIEPNVVLEQYFLKSLCEAENFQIKNVLELTSNNFNDDWQMMMFQAEELGFAHAWGSSKYQVIEPIKMILQERNPTLYQDVIKKISEINND